MKTKRINENYTLTSKIPLSPYSMFAVHAQRTRKDEDVPISPQFRLVKTTLVGQELIGQWGGDLGRGYNPFELYGLAEYGRGQALPPHLVFANLDSSVTEDACAFLDSYGPLTAPEHVAILSVEERMQWEGASRQRTPLEEHFRATLGQVPLLPPPPTPQDDFHRSPVKYFWEEQAKFERALRLSSALNSPSDHAKKIRQALAMTGQPWNFSGPNSDSLYLKRAREFVFLTLNSQLRQMKPRVVRDRSSSSAISGIWPCYSLLEAMYLMLFLDIASRGTRIAQCEKCAKLFYTDREKGKYCSPVCENRARSLRAYYRRR